MIYGLTVSLVGANGDTVTLQDSGNFVLLSGARGFGMPNASVRIDPSTSDGGVWRATRREVRELDLPIAILGSTRGVVETRLRRLARLLQDNKGPTRIVASYQNGTQLFLDAHFIGGAETQFGNDAGLTWCKWVVTLQSPEPFWRTLNETRITVGSGGTGRSLLPQLTKLKVTSGQTLGIVTVNNGGDVPVFPRWEIRGPLTSFTVTDGTQSFSFPDGITGEETYTVDTATATAVNQAGENVYAQLGPAPKFFPFPTGETTISVLGDNATADTRVRAFFAPRFEVVH
jgi:hypothetical protein